MSSLTPADRRFLEGRRLRTHVGLYLLPAALGLVLLVWACLFWWWPLAINPMHAAVSYEGVVVPKGTLTRYAITVTVLVNLVLLVLSVAVTYGILWARSERRYLRLLAASTQAAGALKQGAPEVKKPADNPR